MEKLPPLAPPCTGGGCATLLYCNAFSRLFLPLCKGELEGVVKALALCNWNLKSKMNCREGV